MNKIDARLEIQLDRYPEIKHDVLITLKEGIDPDVLKLPKYRVVMRGIIAASLKTDMLRSLSRQDCVLVIEPDEAVDVL